MKKVLITSANTFTEISETQPNTSDNKILEPLQEESIDFDKTLSNSVFDI